MNLSYQKRINPISGTVTSQTVSINKYQLDAFKDEIYSMHETDNWQKLSNYQKLFIQKPFVRVKNQYFINLTQKCFFEEFFNLHLKDRNTCLLVK